MFLIQGIFDPFLKSNSGVLVTATATTADGQEESARNRNRGQLTCDGEAHRTF